MELTILNLTSEIATMANDKKVSMEQAPAFKRELGFISATSMVIGTVIGSGIFISPKGVLRATGKKKITKLSFS